MIILDTSVWVAYINKDDSQHEQATIAVKKISDAIIVPEYVLLETVTVLVTRTGKPAADYFLDFTKDNEGISILPAGPNFLDQVIDVFRQSGSKKLSFTDTALVILSDRWPVITFDAALNRALKKK